MTLSFDATRTLHSADAVRWIEWRPAHLGPGCQLQAHELDNLYVVDRSFFPSSGAVNPALIIMANALRVAEKIAERL